MDDFDTDFRRALASGAGSASGASAFGGDAPVGALASLDAADLAARLRRLSDEVGRLYHDVNNPLAVISGNAQLLLEIGNAEGLSSDVMEPVADIEVAAQRLVEVLQRLVRLREEVAPFRS